MVVRNGRIVLWQKLSYSLQLPVMMRRAEWDCISLLHKALLKHVSSNNNNNNNNIFDLV